jgi:hypothetical protein
MINSPGMIPPALPVRRLNGNTSQLRSQSLAGSDAFTRVPSRPPPTISPSAKIACSELTTKESMTVHRHPLNKTSSLDGHSLLKTLPRDPFDTDWAAPVIAPLTSISPSHSDESSESTRRPSSTNPFTDNSSVVKTFEIQM